MRTILAVSVIAISGLVLSACSTTSRVDSKPSISADTPATNSEKSAQPGARKVSLTGGMTWEEVLGLMGPPTEITYFSEDRNGP